jgi:hypothetical protein
MAPRLLAHASAHVSARTLGAAGNCDRGIRHHTPQATLGNVLAISVLITAVALALASSVVFNWASDKSAVWNMGFAVVLVLSLATVLIAAIMITVARLGC